MTGKMIGFAFGMALSFVLLSAGFLRSQEPQKKAQDEFSAGNPQLRAYIDEALDRNPGIRQSFARYQAALQRMPALRGPFRLPSKHA